MEESFGEPLFFPPPISFLPQSVDGGERGGWWDGFDLHFVRSFSLPSGNQKQDPSVSSSPPWIVLDSLLRSAADFHAELVSANRSGPHQESISCQCRNDRIFDLSNHPPIDSCLSESKKGPNMLFLPQGLRQVHEQQGKWKLRGHKFGDRVGVPWLSVPPVRCPEPRPDSFILAPNSSKLAWSVSDPS